MPDGSFERLLRQTRLGDAMAQGDLLRRFEPWMRLLARIHSDRRFQAKFDESDIVQQTQIEALRGFPQFRGSTEGEFTAWLRQIMAHTLAHEVRRFQGAQKRDIDLEVSLNCDLARSSQRLGAMLASSEPSPSQRAVQRELDVLLAQALENLPDDYREVLILRHVENLSHDEIAQRMNRSVGAVRMLWTRALLSLRQELGGSASSNRS